MKLLFEFPRFHTNNAGMVQALCDDGHEVTFSVVRESPVEIIQNKTILQKQCRISKIACHLFRQILRLCHFTFLIFIHTLFF